ncbi:MAG: YiiX/YebB-like N1pC/P60 family cysteine hydrolase, partial [Kiritimatiellales bacterium]
DIIPAPAVMAEHASARIGMIFGDIKGLGDESMSTVSLCFGNTVGLVEVRRGKLWKDAAVAARIKSVLRPGDILLEKTPFRLTDSFIPGHWGHVAVWIGTEAELKELGLWDDPVVKPYQTGIRAGKCIVEALRSGVTMNTVEHFMNIDDFGVLRRNPALDRDMLRHHILLALRQVGKAYDFNFDIETTDKIVCSELAYVVYTDMIWPTAKALDRYTISPDNVALKALNGGPFELVLFYHDGRPVNEKPLELMAELMNKNVSAAK